MKQSMMSIVYTKSLKANLNWTITLTKSNWIFLNYMTFCSEMLSFVSNVHDNFYETCSIFYHSLHVWYHDILTNLIIFRLRLIFIEFKTYSARTFVVMFREQDVRIFLSILQQCLKLDSITWISFFHSLYYIIVQLGITFDKLVEIHLNDRKY